MKKLTFILFSTFLAGCQPTPVFIEPIVFDQFKLIKDKYYNHSVDNSYYPQVFFQFCIKAEKHCVHLIEEIKFPLNGFEDKEECYITNTCNKNNSFFQLYKGNMNTKEIQYSIKLQNSLDVSELYDAQFMFAKKDYNEFVNDYFFDISFSKEPQIFESEDYSYFIAIK